ncbi:MAG: twitching motility protein PilT, partial [Lachnospiraceae bacterium]|nr:twitching motility protein PilT [Lachnospiraceae bacterium]
MIQLIVGKKGKGKTKHLLDKVNAEIKDVEGNVVYLDKSRKHMFELNNKIRLIDVPDYLVSNSDEFIGFICGIISQDHDLQY